MDGMVNGILDIGNSSVKWALFRDKDLIEMGVTSYGDWSTLGQLHKQFQVKEWILSSVQKNPSNEQLGFKPLVLDTDTPIPVTNRYKTPSTLGKDRLAGVCGAHELFPDSPALVIDAGTCITYDVVDATGIYHGGNICPGIHMRLKAMHEFTGRLPLLNWQEDLRFMGDDTNSSMIRGVTQGVLGEAERLIAQYQQEFGDLKVLVCGGDLRFFEKNLKMGIFAAPELVPVGLNSILRHKQSLHG